MGSNCEPNVRVLCNAIAEYLFGKPSSEALPVSICDRYGCIPSCACNVGGVVMRVVI